MARETIRINVDPALWQAVQAAAKAKGVPLYAYVEDAFRCAVDPFETIRTSAESLRYLTSNAVEVADQIRLIADFIVDAQRAET